MNDQKTPLMLDSTTLKQNPSLNTELMRELIKYSRANLYSLYVSEVVEQEFLTWVEEEAQKSYDAVANAKKLLNKFRKVKNISGIKLDISPTMMIAENEINGVLKEVTDNWQRFKDIGNVCVAPILPGHGKEVMDAYFRGDPPFRGVKSRSDIPDAFILWSLYELVQSYEKVVFVSSDKNFTGSLVNEDIFCFASLSELFTHGPEKLDEKYFSEIDENNRLFSLAQIFQDDINMKLVRELKYSDFTDIFDEETIEHTVGEYLDTVVDVRNVAKKYKRAKRISTLSYLVPFHAELDCTLISLAKKNDIMSIATRKIVAISKEPDVDGDFEVKEKYSCRVSGNFSVRFDDSDPSRWKEQEPDGVFGGLEFVEITVDLEDVSQSA